MIKINDSKGRFRTIGGNQPCFIIAEMSCNHLGDIQRAKDIVRAAASAGADSVKLQTFRPSTLTLDCDRKDFIVNSDNQWNGRKFYDLYKEVFTPWEWHEKLKNLIEELGMVFISSVFDEEAVEFLETLGIKIYKIASFELTHIPLLKAVARTGKPVILSTGMATLGEIEQAVHTIRSEGNMQIALLRCVSSYPAKPSEANLATIKYLGKIFNAVPGFSDHTLGSATAVASVASGGKIIEKHFTLSRDDGGPDGFFSMEPKEFEELVDNVRIAETAIGAPTFGPTYSEQKSLEFRRSIYAIEDISSGSVFTNENLRVIRPGFGLAPKHYQCILGRRAKTNIRKGDPLGWEAVD